MNKKKTHDVLPQRLKHNIVDGLLELDLGDVHRGLSSLELFVVVLQLEKQIPELYEKDLKLLVLHIVVHNFMLQSFVNLFHLLRLAQQHPNLFEARSPLALD